MAYGFTIDSDVQRRLAGIAENAITILWPRLIEIAEDPRKWPRRSPEGYSKKIAQQLLADDHTLEDLDDVPLTIFLVRWHILPGEEDILFTDIKIVGQEPAE